MPGCWRRRTPRCCLRPCCPCCRRLCPCPPRIMGPCRCRAPLSIFSVSPVVLKCKGKGKREGPRTAARPFPPAQLAHAAGMHRARTALCCEVTGPAFRPDGRCGLHWRRGCRKTCRLSHSNILHYASCVSCMLAALALRVIAAFRCERKPKLGLGLSASGRAHVASGICVVRELPARLATHACA